MGGLAPLRRKHCSWSRCNKARAKQASGKAVRFSERASSPDLNRKPLPCLSTSLKLHLSLLSTHISPYTPPSCSRSTPPPRRDAIDPDADDFSSHSGVARSLRAAALRPAAPAVRPFAPAVQRLASTQASQNDGKVHQVIGAVVDGMSTAPSVAPPPPPERDATKHTQLTSVRSQVRG